MKITLHKFSLGKLESEKNVISVYFRNEEFPLLKFELESLGLDSNRRYYKNFQPIIYKETAQQWLNEEYPNKEQAETIDLADLRDIENTSEFIIENYPNLKKITDSRIDKILEGNEMS